MEWKSSRYPFDSRVWKKPANPRVWHLSQCSLLKVKVFRMTWRCPSSLTVTGYRLSQVISPKCAWCWCNSETARRMKASPSCHFHSVTDQSSFLSSPDGIKWVLLKDREALHIWLYLLLTCRSLDTLSLFTGSDRFHHFCPSTLSEASRRFVFTLHILIHLPPKHPAFGTPLLHNLYSHHSLCASWQELLRW